MTPAQFIYYGHGAYAPVYPDGVDVQELNRVARAMHKLPCVAKAVLDLDNNTVLVVAADETATAEMVQGLKRVTKPIDPYTATEVEITLYLCGCGDVSIAVSVQFGPCLQPPSEQTFRHRVHELFNRVPMLDLLVEHQASTDPVLVTVSQEMSKLGVHVMRSSILVLSIDRESCPHQDKGSLN